MILIGCHHHSSSQPPISSGWCWSPTVNKTTWDQQTKIPLSLDKLDWFFGNLFPKPNHLRDQQSNSYFSASGIRGPNRVLQSVWRLLCFGGFQPSDIQTLSLYTDIQNQSLDRPFRCLIGWFNWLIENFSEDGGSIPAVEISNQTFKDLSGWLILKQFNLINMQFLLGLI